MKILLTLFVLFFSSSVVADECISGDCINGYGIYVWDSGDKYVGENKNNAMNGLGTYYFVTGNKYVGEIKNDLRHGQGTYYYAKGDKYVGGYKNWIFHGEGVLTEANGKVLDCIWKNGAAKISETCPKD